MHNLIFEHQTDLSYRRLLEFSKELRLDKAQFARDFQSQDVNERMESDFESGIRSGVNGTPTFFVNGEKLNTYNETYESLLQAIEKHSNFKV